MTDSTWMRRLRGAAGTAVVWGAAWAAVGFVIATALNLTGFGSSGPWYDSLAVAARLGFMGGIVGVVFSSVIRLVYPGRELSDINVKRFGAGAAIVAGVFVPGFIVVARWLSGDAALPFMPLFGNGLLAAVCGGVAASGSLWLAQRASMVRPNRDIDEIGSSDEPDRLPHAAERDLEIKQRVRETQR